MVNFPQYLIGGRIRGIDILGQCRKSLRKNRFFEVMEIDISQGNGRRGVLRRGFCGVFQDGKGFRRLATAEVVLGDIQGQGAKTGVQSQNPFLALKSHIGTV